MVAVGNTPPQYVFELTAVQAARKFLAIDAQAEGIAAIYANALEPLYNTAELAEDIIRYIQNTLKFIASVEISDVDLLLEFINITFAIMRICRRSGIRNPCSVVS